MAGDGVLARDWVFDGADVWEVVDLDAEARLVCRDPYRIQAEAVTVRLDPAEVAKVRADRADDPAYLRAVFEQAETLRDFWAGD
jgi:hypothetical protein